MTVQTVYDVGDPITSQLSLGVPPDGSTNAAVVVKRPDGTAITSMVVSGWVGDTITAQWWATDDGTSGASTTEAAGDWLAVWTVTGAGANIAAKIYNVAPLPGTGTRPDWSPFLSEVADHVPFLTVDTTTPGSQIYLGTFTGDTTPADEQAQRHVDSAVALMSPALGNISAGLYPTARAIAALRAAASLVRAFPRNPDDLTLANALSAQADAAWTLLVDAVGLDDQWGLDISPAWSFPAADCRWDNPNHF